MKASKVCLWLMITLATGACTGWVERRAVRSTVDLIGRTRAAMAQESDIELARDAIPGSIKTLEGFYLVDPHNRDLIALLAESYCQYAAGFLQDDWEAAHLAGQRAEADALRARARNLAARCVGYAVLLLDEDWQASIYRDPDALVDLAPRSDRGAVVGMFWAALGLGTMLGMDPTDPTLNQYLPAVIAMLERVIDLDPAFADGMPHMTLAIILGSRSAAVGGDPARAAELFEAARAITGGKALMMDVMMARSHAVSTRDRARFRALLEGVVRTPASAWPAQRLANELAHRKARRYLAHEQRFF